MIIDEDEYLAHYGILRKSGRYPWGSGEDQTTRNKDFLGYVNDLRAKGLSDTEICAGLSTPEHPFTTTMLRNARTHAINEQKLSKIAMAQKLRDKGMSNVAIGERMGINESSVRALLSPGQQAKAAALQTTADHLKKLVEEKGAIDVSLGVERHLGVNATQLKAATALLEEQGYKIHQVKYEALGTGMRTTTRVLARPDVVWNDLRKDPSKIKQVVEFVSEDGKNLLGLVKPISVDSKRIGVRYAEEGGADADGVIYVRPGVSDLTLGANRYAQVRIAVDGSHYLKGMAVYKDDLPPGVDLLFNTNKSDTGNKLDAMKKLKDDPDNPFGSVVRQLPKLDANGNEIPGTVRSAMNLVNEEGDWSKWSKTLSSQMLSKQNTNLAKERLEATQTQKKQELEEIMALTNPAVRKRLLDAYADDVDSAAVHLKAAGMPRQATAVILPFNNMKENEIYAPKFKDGERVVLIRYPHGGVFEIPELVVNNSHPEAKKALGVDPPDAIGIHHKVAERLSGADFDGDTVLVIPNDSNKIKTAPALEGLKNFDAKRQYSRPKGTEFGGNTQQLMGDISNLITDMTIRGATNADLARAVKHSMVVIDAEKHNLDYKRSSIEHGIPQLKAKYQGDSRSGATTLISQAKSRIDVDARKQGFKVDPATGRKIYTPTGESWTDKNGKLVFRKQRSKRLAETDDAHTLSSGTPIEKVYADHSNRLKSLANQARKESVTTKTIPYSPSAAKVYAPEVARLNAALDLALRNAPRERNAQALANAVVSAKMQANPTMDSAELKKLKYQALESARLRTGAKKPLVDISVKEWEAIQAGAISNHKLTQILNNADLDQVKTLATPRTKVLMSPAKTNRAAALLASGKTQLEVAQILGVSLSTLKEGIK